MRETVVVARFSVGGAGLIEHRRSGVGHLLIVTSGKTRD
jgi:hypothetical protein